MAAGYDKHECTICLEDFNKPKLLPCAHTFCEDCLTDHIKAHATNNKLPCPICRKSTDIPAGDARGFPNNIYLVEEEDKLFCSKHKKMELKFYCRDCSEVVCGDCVVFQHKGHDVDYTSTVAEETKQHLKPLEDKVAELKKFSENLKHTLTYINSAADTACKNVDKQKERICVQLRERAKEINNNIIQIRDDSINTVHQMMEDINVLVTKIETGVNCSRNVLIGKTTSKSAVAMLPNIFTLIECGRKTNLNLPEVRYPLFPLVDIDTQCLRKLLGELETENEGSFSASFNAKEMVKYENYDSGDYMIHGLPWCVSVERDLLGLYVHLGLNKVDKPDLNFCLKGGARSFKLCTVDVALKLVHKTEDSQSVVKTEKSLEYTSNARYLCYRFIDWEKLTDPSNGFLDDGRFTLQTTVKVTKITGL